MFVIVSALKSEILPFLNYYSPVEKIPLGSGSLYVAAYGHFLRTGIGPEQAEQNLARYLKEYKPDYVLNLGLTGSLNKDYKTGQIFCIERVMDEDTNRYFNIPVLDKVKTIEKARLITVKNAVTDSAQRDFLHKKFNADLVDMEACLLAQVCATAKIPFFCYKIVSDYADKDTQKNFMENYETLSARLFETINAILKPCD